MAILNISPTKSNLLSLKRQLTFAEEGYDLLEQKRQILIFEMTTRMARAQEVERVVAEYLGGAHEALREATLDSGTIGLNLAASGVRRQHQLNLSSRPLMGLRIPAITMESSPVVPPYGVSDTSANTDVTMLRFAALLPKLVELAELQNTLARLARELRKTQRRCNALLKIFIPEYRQTIAFITGTLEERERESLVILKMTRDRLARSNPPQ